MLEKIKRGIDKGITSVGVQSSTYFETSKLQSKIDGLNSTITQIKNELGSNIYNQWKNGADVTLYIDEVCTNIKNLEREIEQYQAKILELKAEKDRILSGEALIETEGIVCSCGQRNNTEAVFCIGCGKKLEVPVKPQQAYCISCGEKIAPDARFCSSCGTEQKAEG